MLYNCKIKSKSASQIVVNNEQIGDVIIGVHKHTMLFLSLRSKEIGNPVEIDVEQYKGQYYCTDSLKIAETMEKAEEILFAREKRAHARKMWDSSPF